MSKYFFRVLLSIIHLNIILSCTSQKNTNKVEKEKWNIGSKQNYTPPSKPTALPEEYELKFVTTVARHGSRYMSGPSEDVALYNLMSDAEKLNQLTEAGKELFVEVQKLIKIQSNNYGKLTSLGKKEHYNMGQRLYTLSPNFFNKNQHFIGNATYKERTQNSRKAFIHGLIDNGSSADWDIHNFQKGNDPLLRFHKISPKYKSYLDSANWLSQINDIINSEKYKKISDKILPRYFKDSILISIEEGIKWYLDGENEVAITSQMDITLAFYECFKISLALPLEQRPNISVFTPNETKLLAKVGDIEAFYEKGPGFINRSRSYSNATTLLMNLTYTMELACQKKLDYQGYFNFAHAETTLPLLVLLNINNVNQKSNNLLNSNWSESEYAKMGTNIQWFLLEKEGEQYVQIRFNENVATLPIQTKSKGLYLFEDYLAYVKTLITPYDLNNTNYREIIKNF